MRLESARILMGPLNAESRVQSDDEEGEDDEESAYEVESEEEEESEYAVSLDEEDSEDGLDSEASFRGRLGRWRGLGGAGQEGDGRR